MSGVVIITDDLELISRVDTNVGAVLFDHDHTHDSNPAPPAILDRIVHTFQPQPRNRLFLHAVPQVGFVLNVQAVFAQSGGNGEQNCCAVEVGAQQYAQHI